jgi:hypothetical protein
MNVSNEQAALCMLTRDFDAGTAILCKDAKVSYSNQTTQNSGDDDGIHVLPCVRLL